MYIAYTSLGKFVHSLRIRLKYKVGEEIQSPGEGRNDQRGVASNTIGQGTLNAKVCNEFPFSYLVERRWWIQ